MKRTAKLLSVLVVLACLLACLPVLSASATPTTATVTTDKTTYAANENVVFTMSSNGTSNTLWVYRVDGQWTNYYQNAGTSMTLAFGWEGEYKALVEAWDGTGSLCSAMIYFTVGGGGTASGGAPTSATIGSDKSVYKLGDLVNFTMTGDGESNTLWVYKPDGTSEYFQNAGTSYSYIPAQAGQYQALMETWNGVGSFCSEKIKFRVVDPNAPVTTVTPKPTTAPTTQKPTTTKPTTVPTTVPTTQPTTVPTTVPTTAPTTRPTTAPTTRPTTRPTTQKPQQVDPCAKGHSFKNGFCIYCAKADPNYNPCANGHTFENGFCVFCAKADPFYNPCANGHTFENGYCVFCTAPNPIGCDRGEHNFVNGVCSDCWTADPNVQDPCANGHDLDETGSCKNCSYYDPDFNPNAVTPDNDNNNNNNNNSSNNDGDNDLWWLIIIALILFVIFVVLAVLLIMKKKKSGDAPAEGAAE